MLVSPCGIICDECPFYNNTCKGCKNINGKVFWSADFTANGVCPLYDCSINNKTRPRAGLGLNKRRSPYAATPTTD